MSYAYGIDKTTIDNIHNAIREKRNKNFEVRKIDVYTNMLQMKYIERIVSTIIECNSGKEIKYLYK